MTAKANMKPHTPVLLNEVLDALAPKAGGIYVDATFGAGGYSTAILSSAECKVIGLDRDATVLPHAQELGKVYGDNFIFVHGNFGNMGQLVNKVGYQQIDGAVLDIGVSSMQLETADRGFSFMHDGPLDMRMDPSHGVTAADIIAQYSEQQLADLFFNYGGERKSRMIAQEVVKARQEAPITSTLRLAQLVKNTVPSYNDTIHPATRTFQALRIEVNAELTELENGLKEAVALLAPLARLVVVTFHSLEDAIVKRYFTELCGKKVHTNKYKPTKVTILENNPRYRSITNGTVAATRAEILSNYRARSAKLRAIERYV